MVPKLLFGEVGHPWRRQVSPAACLRNVASACSVRSEGHMGRVVKSLSSDNIEVFVWKLAGSEVYFLKRVIGNFHNGCRDNKTVLWFTCLLSRYQLCVRQLARC